MLRWLPVGFLLVSCEAAPRSLPEGPGGSIEPAKVGHARQPVEAATELQLAVAQGRLADAHDLAGYIAAHELEDQPGWRPYLDDMHAAAVRIEHAGDVGAAGVALGHLGRACAACHEAAEATTPASTVAVPEGVGTLAAQMQRHEWAATRLWEGVSGPTDRAWTDGAAVMATTPLDVMTAVHEVPNVETFVLAEHLRDQAEHAATLTDPDARANLYGEMLNTCASCHRVLRPQPVVGATRVLQLARSR